MNPSQPTHIRRAEIAHNDEEIAVQEFAAGVNQPNMFGFLLIDGLSLLEEHTIAPLYNSLKGVSIIGGSAGDSLKFEETKIFYDGRFRSGTAVFALIESKLPFRTFKLQHFVPSDADIIITESDPAQRIVYEIDGEPAAEAYADIIGLAVDELTPQVFSAHPFMLQIGNDWYVRSIEKANPEGSLTFYCAIDNGLPLTLAKGVGFVETLRTQVNQLKEEFPTIELTLGCDCILRRLELMDSGNKAATEKLLNEINFLGFSTYGEQFNAIHVNQALTGVVIGGH